MDKEYFVLFGSEDGEPKLKHMTKEEVLSIFKPNKYGDYEYGERKAYFTLPQNLDLCGNFGGDAVVIIKGSLVMPIPKKVVTEYELE